MVILCQCCINGKFYHLDQYTQVQISFRKSLTYLDKNFIILRNQNLYYLLVTLFEIRSKVLEKYISFDLAKLMVYDL